jgi:adenylate cyclase class 2
MATEIEAKMPVESFDSIRQMLKRVDAALVSTVVETNTFFDTRDRALQARDCGLRLRINRATNAQEQSLITFKGPGLTGQLKTREEIELTIDDAAGGSELLQRLGYLPGLSFEKRRESWRLDACQIELDEMPYLGKFIEIEGPSESEVMSVRKKLGLDAARLEKRGYISLLSQYLAANNIADRRITFSKSAGR